MGVSSSLPAPSFRLRRGILAQRGSLLVSVFLVWVILATGPHTPVYPGRSCMLFAVMMALAGAAGAEGGGVYFNLSSKASLRPPA